MPFFGDTKPFDLRGLTPQLEAINGGPRHFNGLKFILRGRLPL